MTAAHLIATNLQALPHPDGTPRSLPGFNTRILPEALKQEIDRYALDFGEAIVHLLELNGYHLQTELRQPTQTTQPETASVICAHCNARVLQLNITNPERVVAQTHFAAQECPNR